MRFCWIYARACCCSALCLKCIFLLIGISSIHSDRVILAMKDYLVGGHSRKEVCEKYQMNNGYFSTTLGETYTAECSCSKACTLLYRWVIGIWLNYGIPEFLEDKKKPFVRKQTGYISILSINNLPWKYENIICIDLVIKGNRVILNCQISLVCSVMKRGCYLWLSRLLPVR